MERQVIYPPAGEGCYPYSNASCTCGVSVAGAAVVLAAVGVLGELRGVTKHTHSGKRSKTPLELLATGHWY
jgi:hypothetical protein